MLGEQINWMHPLGKGIQGFWLFNEGVGNIVQDLSGNSYHGTFAGNTAWFAGKFGSALDFDGTDDYVDTGWYPAAGLYSIVCWVKFDDLAGANDDVVFAGCHDGGDHRLYYGISGTNYYSGAGDSWKNDVAETLVTDVWYQFAFTLDGSTARFYQDTVLIDSFAYGWTVTSTRKVFIGGWDSAVGARWLNGLIDHIIFYNRALSVSEITRLYAKPFCMVEKDNVAIMALEAPAAPGGQVIIISSVIFEGVRFLAFLILLSWLFWKIIDRYGPYGECYCN